MSSPDRKNALDHVVVIMIENRSFDNLLGRVRTRHDRSRIQRPLT